MLLFWTDEPAVSRKVQLFAEACDIWGSQMWTWEIHLLFRTGNLKSVVTGLCNIRISIHFVSLTNQKVILVWLRQDLNILYWDKTMSWEIFRRLKVAEVQWVQDQVNQRQQEGIVIKLSKQLSYI
jgi:hypothetical protein